LPERVRGAAVWVATCGGVGYSPIAPGTAGSALGIVIVAAVVATISASQLWLRIGLALAALLLLPIGAWAGTRAEAYYGKTDPSHVVIDEVAGQFLTLAGAPAVSWKWMIAGLFLFRLLDIIKPFPARRAESLPGGWGIMVDDLIAGAYGALVLTAAGSLM
jgi:phosphatidylglycerophosphatase A